MLYYIIIASGAPPQLKKMWEGLERYGLLLSAFSSFVLGYVR